MKWERSDNKQCRMKYRTTACNGKVISKVMGWGMILKMIRDKNLTQKIGEGW
jgi:hypothetical protein